MAPQPTKHERLPANDPVRYVSVLFPQVNITATPEQIEFYKQHVPYAFVIDRQSNHQELKRAAATGQINRVESIMSAARDLLHVYLPPAILKERVADGEIPYEMDPQFWFVDGERKNATGFAANPNARPQLWRAYQLAHALSDAGVGPSHFIIGEANRFFRNPTWLERFVRSLWGCRPPIQFYCCGFGPVTENTLQGLLAYVQATSQWLPKVKEGYQRACRLQHRIHHNQPKFGVRFTGPDGHEESEIRTEVWTKPEEWNILSEMVHGLADGSLPSCHKTMMWLKERHGVERSHFWVLDVLNDFLLDGIYVCDAKTYTTRVLRQKDRLFDDLDITPSGKRRHLITDRQGSEWQIQYTHGTQPIPSDVLQLARRRVRGRRGRPVSEASHRGLKSIIPGRLLRCAICGYHVKQQAAGPKNNSHWELQCWGAYEIKRKEKVTLEEAQSRCPHLRRLAVDLSPYVWQTLVEGISNNPVPPSDEPPDFLSQEISAKSRVEVAHEAWLNFQTRAERGELGDQSVSEVRDYIESRRAALIKELSDARDDLNLLQQRALSRQQRSENFQAICKSVARYLKYGGEFTDARKKDLIEEIVDHIDVNLGECSFCIHVDTDIESLRRLLGRFENKSTDATADATKVLGQRTTFNFRTILKGRFAA